MSDAAGVGRPVKVEAPPPAIHSNRAAAAKRAAAGDGAGAPAMTSKKRPALASLSNSANVPPASRSSNAFTRVAQRNQKHRAKAGRTAAAAAGSIAAPEPVPEPAPSTPALLDEKSSSSSLVTTVDSLERKAVTSLYISKRPRSSPPEEELREVFSDIDAQEKDPQLCGIYAKDIYQHLRMAELKKRPTVNYMELVQQDINPSMRSILVDWLVEVAEEYKLVPDTLYLAVSFIDRFLSQNVVNRQRLQLLGISCMLIASKYEEISAPQVEEFCYITDNTYEKQELLLMERQVLNYLRFELTSPTPKTFVRRFIRVAKSHLDASSPITIRLEFLGNYLAELCLVEYGFLKYIPSMVAATAVFLANVTIDPLSKPWNAQLVHYSGYKASDLAECVMDMWDLQRNAKGCTLTAVREKYKQIKFKMVSTLPGPEALSGNWFADD